MQSVDRSDPSDGGTDGADATLAYCERLMEAGDVDAARSKLMELETVVPNSEQQWKRLRDLCLKLDDRTRAQVFTEKFLVVSPTCANAHLAYARHFMPIYDERPRVGEAVAKALRNPRSDSLFWQEVTELLSAIEDHLGVCSSARKALALDATDLTTRESLIASLGVLKRQREIRSECQFLAQSLLQMKVTDPLRWARLARIAAEAGAKKEACRYIDTSIEHVAGVNYGVDFELLRALMMTGQPARAMKHLENLVTENSQNEWLWKTLIDVALAGRFYEIAAIAIGRLKSLPYQNPESLHHLETVDRHVKSARVPIFKRFTRWRETRRSAVKSNPI